MDQPTQVNPHTDQLITVDTPLVVRGILFDLDGTLVDSAPDIGNAANAMLDELDLPQVNGREIAGWIGNGIPKLVKRALTGDLDGEPDAALFDRALPVFMRLYEKNVCVDSYMYPGVPETLQALKQQGFTLGVITNKAASCTEPLLDQLGISALMSTIISGDTCTHKKPHPEPLLTGMAQMGVDKNSCVLVGDSVHDLHAADNTGIPAVAVDWGYSQGVDLSTITPHPLISDFSQIPALFTLAEQVG